MNANLDALSGGPKLAYHPSRDAGSVAVFVLDVLVALIVGAGVGLLLQYAAHRVWLSVLVGILAVIVVLAIAATAYFFSDFTRYMKIRGM